MLELKKITKVYGEGKTAVKALDDVNLCFSQKEFVSILGQSGSGKTTMLNIIGGLDQYTKGDLVIDGISTKLYKDKDWDAYRNHKVGFVFQSYNLIPHLSILANVELALTISGVSSKERKERARQALIDVGLEEHIGKKPNQLSGGQMQRVAIARALVNDPTIVLADEPTGALDSETSVQIMELLKKISKDKLVIMVTHNPELAEQYSTRIIEVSDGKVIKDTKPQEASGEIDEEPIQRTSMPFFTALSLSFNNLLTKKFRTLLTAFAGSIGIIGVGLVLALSNGFNTYMRDMENETFAKFPLIVTESFVNIRNIVEESFNPANDGMIGWFEESVHENKITDDYVTYVKDVVEPHANFVTYQYAHSKYFAKSVKSGDKYIILEHRNEPFEQGISLTGSSFIRESNYTSEVFTDKFDVLAGNMFSDDKNEAVLVIDNMNKVSESILKFLGINTKGIDEIDYEKIVGMTFKNMHVDNYYIETNSKTPEEMYRKPQMYDNFVSEISEKDYRDEKNQEITITGIVRAKSDFTTDAAGIYYSRNVEKDRLKMNYLLESEVIVSQMLLLAQNKSAIKGMDPIGASAILGLKTEPLVINIYPKDENNKIELAELLSAYNDNIPNELDHIKHSDITDVAVDIVKEIMKLVTVVLVMFSSISLLVSSVMIGIITYTSVLERTKEIGILRSVGARKRDISRVFNSETVIIGLISGTIGIVLAYAFSPLLSLIIENISGVPNILRLNPLHALLLVLISMALTFLAGLIPSKIAANKDPVAALKNE